MPGTTETGWPSRSCRTSSETSSMPASGRSRSPPRCGRSSSSTCSTWGPSAYLWSPSSSAGCSPCTTPGTSPSGTTSSGTPVSEPRAGGGCPRSGGRELRRPRLHRGTVVVLVAGLIITAAFAVGAQESYKHSQRRLASLQTKLTGYALGAAPIDFERRLGQVSAVVANSADPVPEFRRLIAPSMKPKGPFSSASLIRVNGGKPTLLAHVGIAPIRSPTGALSAALYRRAVTSHELVTARAVSGDMQKLGYIWSTSGSAGTFVVAGA